MLSTKWMCTNIYWMIDGVQPSFELCHPCRLHLSWVLFCPSIPAFSANADTHPWLCKVAHTLTCGPGLCRVALCCPHMFWISPLCSQLRQPLAPCHTVSVLQGHLCSWPPEASLGTERSRVGWRRMWPLCVCCSTLTSYLFSSVKKTKSVEHFNCLFFLWTLSLPFLESLSKCSSLWLLSHLFKYSGLFNSSSAR